MKFIGVVNRGGQFSDGADNDTDHIDDYVQTNPDVSLPSLYCLAHRIEGA
jgi:hypothetical protein